MFQGPVLNWLIMPEERMLFCKGHYNPGSVSRTQIEVCELLTPDLPAGLGLSLENGFS